MTNSRPIKLTGHQDKKDDIQISQEQVIAQAAKEAKSTLAKFVFDPVNSEKFKALFTIKSPTLLVTELNDEKVFRADTAQLKSIFANQKIIPALFALPPEKYFRILFQEKIEIDDLLSLIGPNGMLTTLLNQIDAIPDAFEKGKILHFLNYNSNASEAEINQFLKTINIPKSNKDLFNSFFMLLYSIARETHTNEEGDSLTPEIEAFLGTQSPPSSTEQARISAILRVIKECLADRYDKILLGLIDKGKDEAKTTLAKFVFNPDNREKIKALFTTKSPLLLVHELNEMKDIDQSKLDQLNVIISNQKDYDLLFKLPPEKWLQILIQEKTETQDLIALIGSGKAFDGAVSGILNAIDELKDPLDKARIFHYLNNSAKDKKAAINKFLSTLNSPKENIESFKTSFHQLHRILHKNKETFGFGDGSSIKRSPIGGLLCIKQPEPPSFDLKPEEIIALEKKNENIIKNNAARIKAALRIIRECISDKFNKAVLQLNKTQLKTLQDEQSELLVKQMTTKNNDNEDELEPQDFPQAIEAPFATPAELKREYLRAMLVFLLEAEERDAIPSAAPVIMHSHALSSPVESPSDYDENPFEFMNDSIGEHDGFSAINIPASSISASRYHSSTEVIMSSLPSQPLHQSQVGSIDHKSDLKNTENQMIREAIRLPLSSQDMSEDVAKSLSSRR